MGSSIPSDYSPSRSSAGNRHRPVNSKSGHQVRAVCVHALSNSRSLHESIAKRTVSSLKRVGAAGPLVFAGGVAKNPAMVALFRKEFAGDVLVPHADGTDSQIVGAFGAALCGLPVE